MSTDTKKVRSILNDLIETCKDGQQGFLDAAEHVKDPHLRSMFLEQSQRRAGFAGELQQEVMRLGGEPEESGSTAGALHRGWIDFKAKIAGHSDQAVIDEAERGEDVAMSAYQKALQAQLPADLRATVEMQFASVSDSHSKVRALKIRAHGAA